MVKRLRLAACLFLSCVSCMPTAAVGQSGRGDDPAELLAAPRDGGAYYDLSIEAQRLLGEGQLPEAERAYEILARDYPRQGSAWVALGEIKARLGKYREAAQAYRTAVGLLGPLARGQPQLGLAASLAAAGDRAGALDALELLVFEGRSPRRPGLYDNLAFASLRDDPRFLRIVGRSDVSALSRDQGWRRDVDHLLAEIQRVDPLYRDRPLSTDLVRRAEELKAAIPGLSDNQIYVRLERLIHTLGHGHSGLFPFIPSSRRFTQLPVQFWAFPEGLFIVNATGDAADLAGARVIAIESTPAFEALRQVGETQSNEGPMQLLWTGVYHLGIAQMLNGLGIAPRDDRITLSLRLPDGRAVTRALTPVPLQRRPKLGPPPNVPPQLFLRNVAEAHWFEALPGGKAIYVQLNQVAPDQDETLPQFGLRLRAALAGSPVKDVILDLRHNNGGDTTTYGELLRTLIGFSSTAGNRLYVLIGRGTYSAAANLITDLERLADPVFVGEPSSMSGNNFGDESYFVLPYSGINGAISSVRWQLGIPWDLRRSIVPQTPVQLTAKAYFSGRDPVLETVLDRIASQRTLQASRPAG